MLLLRSSRRSRSGYRRVSNLLSRMNGWIETDAILPFVKYPDQIAVCIELIHLTAGQDQRYPSISEFMQEPVKIGLCSDVQPAAWFVEQ
jgi:hypothetical protein